MERRLSSSQRKKGGGLYFSKPSPNLRFIRSGSVLLDHVLGGGWPLGRVSNVIGDNSAGKTLLAIEAMSNFAKQFPAGKIWYRETEAAFDEGYAAALGLPVDRVHFGQEGQWNTVEDIFEDLTEQTSYARKRNIPGLYIIDSMDALTDIAEEGRDIGENSYGGTKPKVLHQLFRKRVRDIKKSLIHFMVISQTRVKIGVAFGEKTTRSGGASLDFYASQHLKLSKLNQIAITRRKHKHVVGIMIRARCTKNKIGLAHREADLPIRFGYGINDAAACLKFLIDFNETQEAENLNVKQAKTLLKYFEKLDPESLEEWQEVVQAAVLRVWPSIQSELLPKVRKY